MYQLKQDRRINLYILRSTELNLTSFIIIYLNVTAYFNYIFEK